MPNPQYQDKTYVAGSDLRYDESTAATPKKSGAKIKGMIYGDRKAAESNKETGGDMPMRFGTADWKMPAGFKPQPRDRRWGMREADGYAFDVGVASPEDTANINEAYEGDYVTRGSVNKSRMPKGRDTQ